jgi:hypothetical protein
VGTVALAPRLGRPGGETGSSPLPAALSGPRIRRTLPTGLWAVTAAWVAYTVAYLALAPV